MKRLPFGDRGILGANGTGTEGLSDYLQLSFVADDDENKWYALGMARGLVTMLLLDAPKMKSFSYDIYDDEEDDEDALRVDLMWFVDRVNVTEEDYNKDVKALYEYFSGRLELVR